MSWKFLAVQTAINGKFDGDKNQYSCSLGGLLHVRLEGLNKRNFIGHLFEESDEICYFKNLKRENIFRADNSVGFSLFIVSKLASHSSILILDLDGDLFHIRAEDALREGEVRPPFEGFEQQIFIPLDKWTDF